MKSNLDYKIWGIRGEEPQYKENTGAVAIFADGLNINVDAFEGAGDTYKLREKKLFSIRKDGGSTLLFEGTAEQFLEVLERGTNKK